MRWLKKKSVAPVLADLAAGRRALTHEALDELPHSPPLAHLRQVLIGVGALPQRDEHMVRIERFIDQTLAAQTNPEQRQVLHRYTVWHLIRRLRQRNNGHATTIQQFNSVRQRTYAAIAFLDWLTEHQLTLGTCQQSDLDRWLTDDTATNRGPAGHFIRWAHKNKLTSVRVGAHRWMGPTRPLDDQHRWNIARRLLHDDTLKPDDRLAGLLVLLYAQTPAAICRMTIVDVETDVDPVRLHLGSSPIHLPEPVADLARLVASNRKGHATIGALTPSIWLFPGGQPGRPISTGQLDSAVEQTRHPSRHRAQHRTVPTRHRDPGSNPGPHPRHPHRCRRLLATTLRRGLDQLRRRDQPATKIAGPQHRNAYIVPACAAPQRTPRPGACR